MANQTSMAQAAKWGPRGKNLTFLNFAQVIKVIQDKNMVRFTPITPKLAPKALKNFMSPNPNAVSLCRGIANSETIRGMK